MTTSYPTNVDNFAPNPAPTSRRNNPSLANKVTDLSDAVVAVETFVGREGSPAGPGNLVGRVKTLEATPVPSPYINDANIHGFTAWTYDVAVAGGGSTGDTVQQLHTAKLYIPDSTVAKIYMWITAPVTGNVYGALYSPAQALLSQSPTAVNNGNTAGLLTLTLNTPQVVTAGYYYLGFWYVNANPGFLYSAAANGGQQFSANLATNARRFATANTALTTTAPATIGTMGNVSRAFWMAVSA